MTDATAVPSSRTSTAGSRDAPQRASLGTGAWCVDFIRDEGGQVQLGGWAVAPGRPPDSVTFTLNGGAFDVIHYPLVREDIGQVYNFVPNARLSGFLCQTTGSLDQHAVDGFVEIGFVDRATGEPVHAGQSYFYNVRGLSAPMPPPHLRARVHGSDHPGPFLLEGATTYAKLSRVVNRLAGRSLSEMGDVLDWGCGCGRMLRHFPRVQGGADTLQPKHSGVGGKQGVLVGADVDAEAVEWTSRNLPNVTGVPLPLYPPSKLPTDAFDCVIGISVMTHLTEPAQDAWLAELQRVTRKNGMLLLTTHGDEAAGRQPWPKHMFDTWLERGFIDGHSNDLDGVLSDPAYYRTTLHTRKYIERHWTYWFDIVDYLPAYIGNTQDLVVLRRR